MKNIKQQTLKQKKMSGSTHAGVKGMYSHKTRLELVVQSEMDNTPKRAPPLLLNKRMLTKRPEKKNSISHANNHLHGSRWIYYLSTKSSLLHKFHT